MTRSYVSVSKIKINNPYRVDTAHTRHARGSIRLCDMPEWGGGVDGGGGEIFCK